MKKNSLRIVVCAWAFLSAFFSPDTRMILTALKKYGIILAETGLIRLTGGAPDNRTGPDALLRLERGAASNFPTAEASASAGKNVFGKIFDDADANGPQTCCKLQEHSPAVADVKPACQ